MNPGWERRPAVYGLRASGVFIYVGSTGQDPRTRMHEHRSRARRGTKAGALYEQWRAMGIDAVEMVVLQQGGDLEAGEAEWIERLLREGHPLTNDRGLDGSMTSAGPRTKANISRGMRGEPTVQPLPRVLKQETHGTVARYKQGGCRCGECRSVYSAYRREQYRLRRL